MATVKIKQMPTCKIVQVTFMNGKSYSANIRSNSRLSADSGLRSIMHDLQDCNKLADPMDWFSLEACKYFKENEEQECQHYWKWLLIEKKKELEALKSLIAGIENEISEVQS